MSNASAVSRIAGASAYPYVDSSGRKTLLPHYVAQVQTYQSGGDVAAQGARDTYYRHQNYGWVRMDAAQR